MSVGAKWTDKLRPCWVRVSDSIGWVEARFHHWNTDYGTVETLEGMVYLRGAELISFSVEKPEE